MMMNRKTLLKTLLLPGAAALALAAGIAAAAPSASASGPDPLSPSAAARANCAPGQDSAALLRRLAAAQTATQPETKPFRPKAGGSLEGSALPLFGKLGNSRLDAASATEPARPWLDQGIRFAYAFNHQAAAASFRRAQALDPACILCHWGEALVLGPNINAPMEPGANELALAALERARALLPKASDKERALVEALSRRYAPGDDRTGLDAAYADAMAAVVARFPDDAEIAVLAAEALMDTQPWDYWEAAGTRPKGRAAEIVGLLDRALALNPDHAGALHYAIHLHEASATPQRAEPLADRLAALDLEAGHLVHMPSHLYYRIGRYRDSIDANLQAIEADEAMQRRMPQAGLYPGAYYPHNIHFAMSAAQMAGDGATVIAMADKLARVVTADSVRVAPWVQPIMAAQYVARAQYGDPAAVLAVPEPGPGLPFVRGLWRYARGVALAASGRADAAKAEAGLIRGLAEAGDFADVAAAGIPGADILRLAAEVVEARAAQAAGDRAGAIARLQRAAAIQEGLGYTEPPHWYFPVDQALGAQLLLAGRTDEAEAAFRRSLAKAPNDGRALFGLAEVARIRGDAAALKAARADLARAWAGDAGRLKLTDL